VIDKKALQVAATAKSRVVVVMSQGATSHGYCESRVMGRHQTATKSRVVMLMTPSRTIRKA
jgi:hypothetical protein